MGIHIYLYNKVSAREPLVFPDGRTMTNGDGSPVLFRKQHAYLRESYHGNIYATRFLMGEAFVSGESEEASRWQWQEYLEAINASGAHKELGEGYEWCYSAENEWYDGDDPDREPGEEVYSSGYYLPAQVMRARLKGATLLSIWRYERTYQCGPTHEHTLEQVKALRIFVEQAEAMQRQDVTPYVYASF